MRFILSLFLFFLVGCSNVVPGTRTLTEQEEAAVHVTFQSWKSVFDSSLAFPPISLKVAVVDESVFQQECGVTGEEAGACYKTIRCWGKATNFRTDKRCTKYGLAILHEDNVDKRTYWIGLIHETIHFLGNYFDDDIDRYHTDERLWTRSWNAEEKQWQTNKKSVQYLSETVWFSTEE